MGSISRYANSGKDTSIGAQSDQQPHRLLGLLMIFVKVPCFIQKHLLFIGSVLERSKFNWAADTNSSLLKIE